MAQQDKILALYSNALLRSKVDEAFNQGDSYNNIIALCKQGGVDISKSTLTRYKKKMVEATKQGISVGELIAGTEEWKQKQVEESVESKEVKDEPKEVATIDDSDVVDLTGQDAYYNDLNILDSIIHKGFASFQYQEDVDPRLVLQAIDLKNKMTDGALKGMSLKGVEALKLQQKSMNYAMTTVLLQFVPEDKQEDALQALENAEQEFNQSLDLRESTQQLRKALKAGGIKFDD